MKNHKLSTINHQLTIGWLYPELMSTYGDRGNIITLQKRCQWRGISVKVQRLDVGFDHKLLAMCHLLFIGGAQDRQQKIVEKDMREKITALSKAIEDGVPGLYVCGAYQFLGKYYKEADGTKLDGLGIFDLYTENPGPEKPRLIGNIIATVNSKWSMANGKEPTINHKLSTINSLVGFENHGGRTYLGKDIKPLATVTKGYGNNGMDGAEGAVYKNSFGTYMHGPLLPKNPHFADMLIQLALEKKYDKEVELQQLDDSLELQTHTAVIKKIQES